MSEHPQCIYELSWGQPYQFSDWTILRTGNSAFIAVQEYAALWFEVVLKPNKAAAAEEGEEVVTNVPTIIATLITRGDTPLSDSMYLSYCPEQMKADYAKREGLERLGAKVLTLSHSSDEEQVKDCEGIFLLSCERQKVTLWLDGPHPQFRVMGWYDSGT